MSDSSDDSVNIEIPYSQRPEWTDVTPITQDNETNEIVRIAYTDTFSEIYGYLRAVLKANEISERAFELTKDAALLNPANYTVWYYRRKIILELRKDLNEELEFITEVIRSHPKNYQVWQHRRSIVDYLQDPSQELEFTQNILKRDPKNYHAWQYRQWVMNKFSLWDNELAYVNELIELDIRNNSAWNQRYFFLSKKYDLTRSESSDTILKEEIVFCLNKIDTCIDNESSWNYLRALIIALNNRSNSNSSVTEYPLNVIEFCEKKLSNERDDEKSPFLLSFIVDFNMTKVKELTKELANVKGDAGKNEMLNSAIKEYVMISLELLEKLGSKYDTIRVNYWNYVISRWQQQCPASIN